MGFGRALICSLMVIFSYRQVLVNGQDLTDGFYSVACPLAESIVRATVAAAFFVQPNIAPGLLKLHYSDCFVEGCDGSVLISGPNTEKTAAANLNLGGFEVIEDIKRQIELVCPGVVSCADILASAARDSVVLTNGSSWDVKSGRKDGRVSLAANVDLPFENVSITSLLKFFAAHGLNTEDFVALLGRHTIGTAACKFVTDTISIDLTIDPLFLTTLQTSCPIEEDDGSSPVTLDMGSELVFDSSILTSTLSENAALMTNNNKNLFAILDDILKTVTNLAQKQRLKKALATVSFNMSVIGVKTGVYGEIRKSCSKAN
ncbi:unnamed protein product [Microthlaspi erraticum]|uniref:Peroxidase n=1 Tax=Microthlaspi erraticum TaxID=1685480 RepID=A0A6D2I7N2_9BRAS|nr:unnamed protein product [Microthlaspi erraticum]